MFLAYLALAALVGCAPIPLPEGETPEPRPGYPEGFADEDADGWSVADGDCDDSDPEIHPRKVEECNGIDDNCNGRVDEYLPDEDLDGICDELEIRHTGDCCRDEACNGLDDDGDGQIDEGYDVDGDGYMGDCISATSYGEVLPQDCDDWNPAIHPGAAEVSQDLVDQDCDGLVDEDDWQPGDLVLTEIMVNPKRASDRHGEWVEVLNTSERTVVLDHLVLEDGERHAILPEEPLLLKPGESAVLGDSAIRADNGDVEIDYAWQEHLILGNQADALVLHATSGDWSLVLDEVAWDETWPVEPGASLSLDPSRTTAADNDHPGAWCASTEAWIPLGDLGSPGSPNPPCQ